MTEKIREAELKAEALTDEELEEVTGGGYYIVGQVIVVTKVGERDQANIGGAICKNTKQGDVINGRWA